MTINQNKLIYSLLFFLLLPDTSFTISPLITPEHCTIAGISAAAATIISIIGTRMYDNRRLPAALKQKKLEIAQEEKRKKEQQEKEIEERKRLQEAQKKKAENLLTVIGHSYAPEITILAGNENHIPKDSLIHIIRSKHNDQIDPFATYLQSVKNDLQRLRNETSFPENKHHERVKLIQHLADIIFSYNLTLSDAYKEEQQKVAEFKHTEQTQQRKKEKEELEIQKLRIKVKDAQHNKNCLQAISQHVAALDTKVEKQSIEMLRLSSAVQQILYETKLFSKRIIKNVEDAIKKLQSKVTPAQSTPGTVFIQAPPASFTPENTAPFTTQPACPAPSAPPFGT